MTIIQPQSIIHQRYQLLRQLGHNAGRETWLAQDLQQDQELVVVKLLTFGGNVQWEDLKLFEREANVLKQLNHPQIPKYRDYFAIDDRSLWFGLVQEYIQGDCLRDVVVGGTKFSEMQVKQIAIAILEILIYLHELNPPVLHRDIKPSNLILVREPNQEWKIYLVDFGAAQDRASAEGKSFTVVGTYGYAPIEQYGGRAVAASDLYALGATLIYLLTGISPADLPQDDNGKMLFGDRTSISSHLRKWIQQLVEPNVRHRYATAQLALKALQEPAIVAKPQPSPISRKRRYIYPPENTRIVLNETKDSLQIVIGSKPWIAILLSILLLAMVTILYGLIINILIGGSIFLMVSIIFIILLIKKLSDNLTATQLEVNELTVTLSRYIFGKKYFSAEAPRHNCLYEPNWEMMKKGYNNNFFGWLVWISNEKNDDNSIKNNIKLHISDKSYLLSTVHIRPTEVNWLIDVLNNFRSNY
ncbi:MAG: serine/threonine-protein kinase [Pseudanabaenaceae cyanobacterium bins.39]|nr:serine/threonine-protein kinase [Pseudanabaenaceae cyanobacterium bins.39]